MMIRPTRQRNGRRGRRVYSVELVLGVLGMALWAGCSIEKNYQTLSFFFDGVPNPEAKARAAAALTEDMRKSATYSIHKPFAEEQCAECHSGRIKITDRDSAICMKCHDKIPEQFPRMHGPVAARACLWCHSPHESAEAHLLRKPSREVCTQCHDPALLDGGKVAAHADKSVSCLDCHSGHGGNARMFLKEGISRLAPEGKAAAPETR